MNHPYCLINYKNLHPTFLYLLIQSLFERIIQSLRNHFRNLQLLSRSILNNSTIQLFFLELFLLDLLIVKQFFFLFMDLIFYFKNSYFSI